MQHQVCIQKRKIGLEGHNPHVSATCTKRLLFEKLNTFLDDPVQTFQEKESDHEADKREEDLVSKDRPAESTLDDGVPCVNAHILALTEAQPSGLHICYCNSGVGTVAPSAMVAARADAAAAEEEEKEKGPCVDHGDGERSEWSSDAAEVEANGGGTEEGKEDRGQEEKEKATKLVMPETETSNCGVYVYLY